MYRTTTRVREASPVAIAAAARGVAGIARRLRAQLALETPRVRRALVAVLLVMPGGLGIVFVYLLFRSPRRG
ncbi:MAG TPA: hypothetical protein VLC55_08490 [Burkholderiales bacterium]|nr:hypothetical protein [Burkholderiales bacterium]